MGLPPGEERLEGDGHTSPLQLDDEEGAAGVGSLQVRVWGGSLGEM